MVICVGEIYTPFQIANENNMICRFQTREYSIGFFSFFQRLDTTNLISAKQNYEQLDLRIAFISFPQMKRNEAKKNQAKINLPPTSHRQLGILASHRTRTIKIIFRKIIISDHQRCFNITPRMVKVSAASFTEEIASGITVKIQKH